MTGIHENIHISIEKRTLGYSFLIVLIKDEQFNTVFMIKGQEYNRFPPSSIFNIRSKPDIFDSDTFSSGSI